MATPPPAAALGAAPDLAEDYALYPCSDGKPMAGNSRQAWAMHAAADELRKAHRNAFVTMDLLVYPEEGNGANSVAPDVLLAFGVGAHDRGRYLVWCEGKPPDWVLEVASPSTVWRDLSAKRGIYAAMGVPEYWLFDPQGDLFPSGEPRLQGLSLSGGRYRPLPSRIEGGERMIRSDVLKLDLRVDLCMEGKLIRFRDPATGQDICHSLETETALVRETARADAEAALRRTAEGRVAEADARANAEAALRHAAEARMAQSDKRAAEAEARLAEMAATIERLRAD